MDLNRDLAADKLCQAEGCTVGLSQLSKYCQQRKLCPTHLKAPFLLRKGCGSELWRFCQQCGKLEPVSAFDEGKRSCRVRLAKRRDKTAATSGLKLNSVYAFNDFDGMPEAAAAAAAAAASISDAYGVFQGPWEGAALLSLPTHTEAVGGTDCTAADMVLQQQEEEAVLHPCTSQQPQQQGADPLGIQQQQQQVADPLGMQQQQQAPLGAIEKQLLLLEETRQLLQEQFSILQQMAGPPHPHTGEVSSNTLSQQQQQLQARLLKVRRSLDKAHVHMRPASTMAQQQQQAQLLDHTHVQIRPASTTTQQQQQQQQQQAQPLEHVHMGPANSTPQQQQQAQLLDHVHMRPASSTAKQQQQAQLLDNVYMRPASTTAEQQQQAQLLDNVYMRPASTTAQQQQQQQQAQLLDNVRMEPASTTAKQQQQVQLLDNVYMRPASSTAQQQQQAQILDHSHVQMRPASTTAQQVQDCCPPLAMPARVQQQQQYQPWSAASMTGITAYDAAGVTCDQGTLTGANMQQQQLLPANMGHLHPEQGGCAGGAAPLTTTPVSAAAPAAGPVLTPAAAGLGPGPETGPGAPGHDFVNPFDMAMMTIDFGARLGATEVQQVPEPGAAAMQPTAAPAILGASASCKAAPHFNASTIDVSAAAGTAAVRWACCHLDTSRADQCTGGLMAAEQDSLLELLMRTSMADTVDGPDYTLADHLAHQQAAPT